MASFAYETPPQRDLAAVGGQAAVFAVGFPTRVKLAKLVVVQTAGTPQAFDVQLYSRQQAADDASLSAESDTDPRELFEVGPLLTSEAPGLLRHAFGDPAVYFFNHDDQASSALGQNRKIYVVVRPHGVGPVTFTLIIGCETGTAIA